MYFTPHYVHWRQNFSLSQFSICSNYVLNSVLIFLLQAVQALREMNGITQNWLFKFLHYAQSNYCNDFEDSSVSYAAGVLFEKRWLAITISVKLYFLGPILNIEFTLSNELRRQREKVSGKLPEAHLWFQIFLLLVSWPTSFQKLCSLWKGSLFCPLPYGCRDTLRTWQDFDTELSNIFLWKLDESHFIFQQY